MFNLPLENSLHCNCIGTGIDEVLTGLTQSQNAELLPRDLIAERRLISIHAYNVFMSSIFITYLTFLIRVMKCTHVICCWQEPQNYFLQECMIIVWKSISISSCSLSGEVLLLNFKTIQFCCLSSEALKKCREELHLPSSLQETSD